jgi:hypothetical protein
MTSIFLPDVQPVMSRLAVSGASILKPKKKKNADGVFAREKVCGALPA